MNLMYKDLSLVNNKQMCLNLTCNHEPCRVIIQSPAMNKFGKDVDPRIMYLYEPIVTEEKQKKK